MNPVTLLQEGAKLLAPVLEPAGFQFTERETGVGSGGPFAVGVFTNGARTLELHVRHTLGIVTYRAAGVTVAHDVLMRAVSGGARPSYPGFSDDPLESFRHLRSDLERYGETFLRGSDQSFAAQARAGELLAAERRGFRALS